MRQCETDSLGIKTKGEGVEETKPKTRELGTEPWSFHTQKMETSAKIALGRVKK